MVTINILLLLTVLGGLFGGCSTVSADGNKEHVHIKVHVPQLIKKHTHVRTIYKHHFKGNHMKHKKGKHSYKNEPPQHSYYEESPSQYYGQDRRDPDVRRAHSPSKHQKWMDQLVAAESLVHNKRQHSAPDSAYSPTNIAQSDADILSEWQHNFEQLNSKPSIPSIPAKRTRSRNKQHQQRPSTKVKSSVSSAEQKDRPPSKLPISGPSDTLDYRFFDSLPDDRSNFFQPTTNKRPTAQKLSTSTSNQNAAPKPKTPHRSAAKKNKVQTTHQPQNTDYSRNPIDYSIPTNHSPQHRAPASQTQQNHNSGSKPYYHSTGFRPPPLLAITEDDIRTPAQTSVRSNRNNNKPKSNNGRNKKTEIIGKPHNTQTFDNDGFTVIETSDWGGVKPSTSYHSFPNYMQTVSGAMQYNQPIVAEPDDYSDHYRPQFTSISAPSGPSAPMSMAQHMSPSAQRANNEDEEFRPFKGSVQMNYSPTGEGHKSNGADEDRDESLENGGDSDEKDEREKDSNESSEHAPFSFDEVPYQTFTKRKNLLRNAHRE